MALAIVTCFFNFAGFNRPAANLHRFLRQMAKDRVPVYGVEMSFDGRFLTHNIKHTTANWKQVILDPQRQTLWQKEAALNLAARQLPPDITEVAWVDADVWFTNPHWVAEASQALTKA